MKADATMTVHASSGALATSSPMRMAGPVIVVATSATMRPTCMVSSTAAAGADSTRVDGCSAAAPASTKKNTHAGCTEVEWVSMIGALATAWTRAWTTSIAPTEAASRRDTVRPGPGALARRANAPKRSTFPRG